MPLEYLLPAALPQLAAFLEASRARGDVPLPGDVDIIAGGPPCQSVSAGGAAVFVGPWTQHFTARRAL